MFKKGVSIFLALLMAAGICACSKKAGSGGDTGTTAAQSQVQSSTTAAAGSKEETTAAKKGDKKTTAKNKKTTAGDKATSAKEKATSSGKKPTTKTPSPTKKPTTKQPTSQKQALAVSFTIDCSQAVGKVEGLPKSGYFLKGAGVSVSNGANVYEALVKCCDANGVDMVASKTMYGMYVSAIGGLAEKDTSKTSGWTYTVNGKYPPKACDKYALSDGDVINFIYKN
ncbi:MAG: DUF4430 domain-containing protein [Clostridia bacterium]|nr:DUF4430 domain-containing protein [Clostridia bacterium]